MGLERIESVSAEVSAQVLERLVAEATKVRNHALAASRK
jgi:hypothetical protein